MAIIQKLKNIFANGYLKMHCALRNYICRCLCKYPDPHTCKYYDPLQKTCENINIRCSYRK